MPTDPPIWPGDGKAMVWDEDRWRHPVHPVDLCRNRWPIASYRKPSGMAVVQVTDADTPQAALDALHARLCEQADALAAVTGRGTVGDVPEKHLQTRYHKGCLCRWCKVKRQGAEETVGDVVAMLREHATAHAFSDYEPHEVLEEAADAIERGEHVGGGRG